MRTAARTRSSSFRRTPLAAAVACVLTAHGAFAACPTATGALCVTNTAASGTGSLYDAVSSANATCGSVSSPVIEFDIAGTGPFVISPAGSLFFSCGFTPFNPTIDGTSQPGWTPNTSSTGFNATLPIVIDGSGSDSPGISINALSYGGALTIKGVQVQNHLNYGGIAIQGPVNVDGSRITGNIVGIDAEGIDPDGFFGPSGIGFANIGSASLADRNVLRNVNDSVVVSYGGHVNIVGNLIGTDDTGTAAGGGSMARGILLQGANSINIQSNVISANTDAAYGGVYVEGSSAVSIFANKIGVGSGGSPLGNAGHGILSDNSSGVQITSNTIANNGVDGVSLLAFTSGHAIRFNRIRDNGRKAINLTDGATQLPNDTDDPDSGANSLQNYPVISSVVYDGTNTTIQWSLNTAYGGTYAIDFFSNFSATAQPQATTYLDPSILGFTQATASTPSFPPTAFGTTVIPGSHDYITATATNTSLPDNETSELAAAALAVGVDLSPTSLNFGNVVVDDTSGPLSATLTSLGSEPYVISFIGDSAFCYGGTPICSTGDFVCSTTCATSTPYATGPACTFSATYAPTLLGPSSTTIRICDNAGERTLTLTGTGIAPPPATIAPSSFDFGSLEIGGQSATQGFLVDNPGPVEITLSSFTVTGPYTIVSNTCGATLAATSSCAVGVKFAPVAVGAAGGTLSATASSGGVSATLNGTGTASPAPVIGPPSFDFGSVVVGTTSANNVFTLTNPALLQATLSAPAVTSPFALVGTTCGATLASGASCTTTVNFAPAAPGPASGSLAFTTSAGPASSSLAGTGTAAPPPTLLPSNLDFGSVVLGASSADGTFTVHNPSPLPITVGAISVTSPFALTGTTCTSSLAASASCTANVNFTPAVIGPASGSLTVATSAGTLGSGLAGTGTAAPPPTLTPPSINFGTVVIGTTSLPETFTLTNPGSVPATLSGLTVTAPFVLAGTTCGGSLAPSASCEADVEFTPVAVGPVSGTISATSSAGPISGSLSGTGATAPPAAITPAGHDFGAVFIGFASAPTTFTVTNSGPLPVALTAFTVTPPFSLLSTTCGSSIPASSSCTADVKFTPTVTGPATGSISATAGSTAMVASLAGTGSAAPAPEITPAGFNFGPVLVGSAGAATNFTIKNPAPSSASLSPLSLSGPFQLASTTCGATLGALATCTASVRFVPSSSGLQLGSLTATTTFGASSASLSGTGVRAPVVEIPRGLIDFGSLLLNAPPATRSLTLRNTGNATFGINSVATTSPFTLANGCGVSVGAGDSCVINVNFNPTVLGEFSGFLNLSTNAPGAAFVQIPLHAIVQARPEPLVRVTPRAIGFGNRLAATRSPTNRVTITNDGGSIADLQLSVTQPHFVIASTTCGPTLAPQSSCFADLAFQPVSFGPKLGDFVVTSNSPGSPISVNLAGAGCRPVAVTQGRGATPLNCSP